MRIIIETDSNAKPQIQMGSQGAENSESLQSAPLAAASDAINAGPPKLSSGQQPTGSASYTESSAPQSDSGSGGAAPKDLSA